MSCILVETADAISISRFHSSRRENKRNIKSKDNKMFNFQDLPDELVLKVLSYSKTKDLFSCGQVSKRVRRISHDSTLWVTANLENKIVKAELLDIILEKGCRILNLRHTTIVGSLSSNTKSPLSVLNLSDCDCDASIRGLEELLLSCCSLQHLVIEGVYLTATMAVGICKNGKTLQTLNLKGSYFQGLTCDRGNDFLLEILKCCQSLKEVDLSYIDDGKRLTEENLAFLAKTISPNLEKLNLCRSLITEDHVKILRRRCNKIKSLSARTIQYDSFKLTNTRTHVNFIFEKE